MTSIGDRVVAIVGTKDGVTRWLGEGVYAGDFPVAPEAAGLNFGQLNPRIDLDCGKSVWGCECWWGPKGKVEAQWPDRSEWVLVDIDEVRFHGSTHNTTVCTGRVLVDIDDARHERH